MEPVMYISEFHKMPNYMNKECETCFVKQKSKCNSQTAIFVPLENRNIIFWKSIFKMPFNNLIYRTISFNEWLYKLTI